MAAHPYIDPKATDRSADALALVCVPGITAATMGTGFIVRDRGAVANGENHALVARYVL
jgi:hypothetical protein